MSFAVYEELAATDGFVVGGEASVPVGVLGDVRNEHSASGGGDGVELAGTAELAEEGGFVPVAVADFDVVGTTIWGLFDVEVGDVQDYFFAVGCCDAPFALFAVFGGVVVEVGGGGEGGGVGLVRAATFWKKTPSCIKL